MDPIGHLDHDGRRYGLAGIAFGDRHLAQAPRVRTQDRRTGLDQSGWNQNGAFAELTFQQDERRAKARRPFSKVIEVSHQQHVPGLDPVTDHDFRLEALALQPDRIDAGMKQDFQAGWRPQRHSVACATDSDNLAGARCSEYAFQRFNPEAGAK